MTLPAPFSVLVIPGAVTTAGTACVSFHCAGPDPLTEDEARQVQAEHGYAALTLRNFERIRTAKWWVSQWWCE